MAIEAKLQHEHKPVAIELKPAKKKSKWSKWSSSQLDNVRKFIQEEIEGSKPIQEPNVQQFISQYKIGRNPSAVTQKIKEMRSAHRQIN